MFNKIHGNLSSKNLKIGIVVSKFNFIITEKLLSGAIDCFLRNDGEEKNLTVAFCPGALEIAPTSKKLKANLKLDAIVCLGCVVKGETLHFDYVASESAKAVSNLANEENAIPVIYGILTTETMEQAFDRCGGKNGNKGYDAMQSAIEMVNLFSSISRKK